MKSRLSSWHVRFTALASCITPAVCNAEVIDKIPSLTTIWVWGVVGAIVGLLVSRIRWWLLYATPLIPIVYFSAMIVEINSSDLGPAIRIEAGSFYIVSVYLGLALVLVGHIAGYLWWRKSRTQNGESAL